MKIVNRSTFLSLPTGTVYSKFELFDFGDLHIKGDTIGSDDFCSLHIAGAIRCDGSDEALDILDESMKIGGSFVMDFDCEIRDGCFESEQLFAVWETADVAALINRLVHALVSSLHG